MRIFDWVSLAFLLDYLAIVSFFKESSPTEKSEVVMLNGSNKTPGCYVC